MSNSPLATLQVPAHPNNYTRGRGGHKIDMVVMHKTNTINNFI